MAILTPTWLTVADRIVGTDHPQFSDTVNAGIISLNTALLVGHEQTGFHTARRTGLSGEIGSFAGNGAARTITLTNTGLTPKKVLVWEIGGGAEKVTNGNFDSDVSGWSTAGCLLTNVSGGFSGNCCQSNFTGGAGSSFYQIMTGLTPGRTYTLSCYIKDGTLSSEGVFVLLGSSYGTGSGPGGTTGAAWAPISGTVNATATSMYVSFVKSSATTGTLLIDSISLTETGGTAPTRIDLMGSEKAQPSRYYTTAWAANIIDNLQAGSFDVEDGCNTSGVTNYYFVLGIDEDTTVTGDAGAGADPTWIPSGTAYKMIADGTAVVSSGNYGNNVVSEMWTLWLHEHANTGAHSITLQDKHIETISWSGNDADDRNITLAITDLDIAYIEVYEDGMPVASKSTDMAGDTTKDEDAAAFAANLIQSIATNGQFQVGTGLNASGNTYIAIVIGV